MWQQGHYLRNITSMLGRNVPGISVPDDYEITIFALGVAAPRYIAAHPTEEVIFVSERGGGRVTALQDEDSDNIADEFIEVASGFDIPSGLQFYDGSLYVADKQSITRVVLDENYQETEREVLVNDLPTERNEDEVDSSSRALLVHDDQIYVSVEASCKACEENDPRRATVMVYDLDGSNGRPYTRGLYKVQGLAVNPINGEIWATNQARPQFDTLPETIFSLQDGINAGYPFCYGEGFPDPDFGEGYDCKIFHQPLGTISTPK